VLTEKRTYVLKSPMDTNQNTVHCSCSCHHGKGKSKLLVHSAKHDKDENGNAVYNLYAALLQKGLTIL